MRSGAAQESIEKYRFYLWANEKLLGDLAELRGKDLVCWCAPEPFCWGWQTTDGMHPTGLGSSRLFHWCALRSEPRKTRYLMFFVGSSKKRGLMR
jgi:hypothetical protein